MAIEQRDGVLDQITGKGIVLGGARLSYSKWFEGDLPTEDLLGCKIRVVVDAGEKCTFLKKIVQVGQKTEGWTPPEPGNKGSFGGGGGRRFSPEELELKRDEGIRIARSVAVDRAITLVKEGLRVEEIAQAAQTIEEYILKGTIPAGALEHGTEGPAKGVPEKPSSASPRPPGSIPESARLDLEPGAVPRRPAKPKKLASQAVNALFNEAKRGGLVADWSDYVTYFQSVLKVAVKSPYHLGIEEFVKVESSIRSRLKNVA